MSAVKDQIGVWGEALDKIGVTYKIKTGAYDDWSIHAGLPYTLYTFTYADIRMTLEVVGWNYLVYETALYCSRSRSTTRVYDLKPKDLKLAMDFMASLIYPADSKTEEEGDTA